MTALTRLAAALAVSGCATPRSQAATTQVSQGPRFSLELSPRPNYKTTIGWFPFMIPVYPQALPAWSSLRQGELDSVSAATSAGKTIRESGPAASLPAGDYTVKLEPDRSYDYNATFATDSAGVCG